MCLPAYTENIKLLLQLHVRILLLSMQSAQPVSQKQALVFDIYASLYIVFLFFCFFNEMAWWQLFILQTLILELASVSFI